MRAYERLIKYTTYDTASHMDSGTFPSSLGQLAFGKALVEEMLDLGIKDATIDENGYVFGTIPATIPNSHPVIGFLAHMDVTDQTPWTNIKARLIENYDGGNICLNQDLGIYLRPDEYQTLRNYVGNDLIVTDGTTLLGADDKAGVAEIMTMAEVLMKDPTIPHGAIKIGFTPDEEIGKGHLKFDVNRFGADFAYTVDGVAFGEVTYETFNIAVLRITVNGKNTHSGSAKNIMRNSIHIAYEFNNLLPVVQRPEYTQNQEGFFHLMKINGKVEQTHMSMIICDHDASLFEKMKSMALNAASFLNEKYGLGTVEIDLSDMSYNMAEKIKPQWHLIENAYNAIKQVGGNPFSIPARYGTDGAQFSYMGLPCPDLGTGSHNHHSKFEFASVQAMDSCVQMLVEIAKIYGGDRAGSSQ